MSEDYAVAATRHFRDGDADLAHGAGAAGLVRVGQLSAAEHLAVGAH